MVLSGWQVLLAALLFGCLASFGWAMRNFFTHPAGTTGGMKLTSACGIVSALLHFAAILLWPHSVTPERGLVAVLFYLGALALFWWSIRTSSKAPLSAIYSPDTPVHLVEDGPYRFIRHPLYCSYILTWSAGLIATAQLWLLPTVAAMLVIYFNAAAVEERKFSHSALAGAYQEYRSRTGLLIPNPLKLLLARRVRLRLG
jgi:protein-S-isoprenylcysteine O-methyltransferase Ste14